MTMTGSWWHVYPLGFLGAPQEALPDGSPVQHRLARLEPWLEYAARLGVEGVVLGPVFAAQTHGYDTVDHFQLDTRLGDEDDLRRLLSKAHDLGLRVVLDGVFNHVGREFAAFRDVLANGPSSQFASWFRLTWPDPGGSNPVPEIDVFEGHQQLVALNHEEPAVIDHVAQVLNHWCARGVDGWRLDAAYAVPTGFWRQVLGPLREQHPQAWVFAELIHGDYAGFVSASGVDSATQYELWKAIGSAINDANLFELAHALGRHNTFLEVFVPVTFLGNHDTTRIASRLADPRHLPHALAVLFGVGGTPVVYAGDEQAFRGIKYEREGGDDEIRPAFPELPDDLSRLGEPTFGLHQRLIGLRRVRPWLASARTSVSELTNTTVVLTSAPADSGDDRIAVALSLQDEPAVLPLPSGFWWTVEEGDGGLGPADSDSGQGSGGAQVLLPGHGWCVLSGSRSNGIG
jgi:cyclomaltodextrinase / maltogenic alpha-amylase / neopullulanase